MHCAASRANNPDTRNTSRFESLITEKFDASTFVGNDQQGECITRQHSGHYLRGPATVARGHSVYDIDRNLIDVMRAVA